MRKVIWLMHVSLDGFVAGPNGEMDWIYLDDEVFEDVHGLVSTADTALFGRVTYQLMESYWPTAADSPTATKHDIDHSRWINPAPKIVFSRTLEKTEWQNTRIVKDHIAEEISELKKQTGKNLILFASPGLGSTFMNLDLIQGESSVQRPE
jgi:dihydrofolate reductase